MTWGLDGDHQCRTQYSFVDLGGVALMIGRTSPVACTYSLDDSQILVGVNYAGRSSFRDGLSLTSIDTRQILAYPGTHGRLSTHYCAGINFRLDRAHLQQVMHIMGGGEAGGWLAVPFTVPHGDGTGSSPFVEGFFGLFGLVDVLIQEDRHLGAWLGLDDQLYRLMALSCFQHRGVLDRVRRRWSGPQLWSARLDDLVDYIRAHAHQPLTLTDLEAQSHYSGRQLQNLFRDRLGCTPMQFVRRQRLALAMDRLTSPQPGDTVTRIARECGYRHTSTFSAEFRRQFGRTASEVLRAAWSQPPQSPSPPRVPPSSPPG